jgi:hypothetical protein
MELTLKQIIRNVNSLQLAIEKSEIELSKLSEKANEMKKRYDSQKTKYDESIQTLINILSNESK